MRAFAFYQKFAFNRERLARMVQCIAEGEAISEDAVATYMGVNPYMVQGFRGWLCKTGLGNATKHQYELSDLGALIARYDRDLARIGSQWVLHYHLSVDNGERAEVWYRFSNEFAIPGRNFARPELETYVGRVVEEIPSNKTALANDVKQFLNSYTNSDALGDLHLVRKVDKEHYTVGPVHMPELHIFAYALFDSWMRHYPGIDTLRLTQICQEPEFPGKIFSAQREQIIGLLNDLQSHGLVTVADTQQEPVTRRFHQSPLLLLERYYQSL